MNITDNITYWMEEVADTLVHGGNLGHLLHSVLMLEIAMHCGSKAQLMLQYELIGYAYMKEV